MKKILIAVGILAAVAMPVALNMSSAAAGGQGPSGPTGDTGPGCEYEWCTETETPPPPTQEPASQYAFIFRGSCDNKDTFVRFTGGGNGFITVNGVTTNYFVSSPPQDIDLGAVEGTVTAGGMGGDSTTLTVSYADCPTTQPSPSESPSPPWSPTFTPHPPIPTHTNAPGGGSTAFTGANVSGPLMWAALIVLLGLLALGGSWWMRRRAIAGDKG